MCNKIHVRQKIKNSRSKILGKGSGKPTRQKQLLVFLANEHFAKFVVTEGANAEGWEDSKTSSKGDRLEFSLDHSPSFCRGRRRWLGIVVHRMNVEGSSSNLHRGWNRQCSG